MTFSAALAAVNPGQMILLQPGRYDIPFSATAANTINLDKSGTANAKIYMVAANCGKAVFNFSFPDIAPNFSNRDATWRQNSYGFYLTGSYWYLKGIEVTRAGYQGVYVTGAYNTFENCAFYDNRNSGLEINKGGSYTKVINSDSYRNFDPKKFGSMADGFASKEGQGAGNFFYGCRAWENSDDGWDTYNSNQAVVIENSMTFRNGINYWKDPQFGGNGNGFKLGGLRQVQNNRITNSVSFGHPNKGFDQNNNAGGITVINNTSFNNGTNYGFSQSLNAGQKHVFRNNVSLGTGGVSISNADARSNSWDTAPVAQIGDFLSVDLNQALRARNPDGTLPFTPLFRLAPGSRLINAGEPAGGLPFLGSAPDLGAFEKQ